MTLETAIREHVEKQEAEAVVASQLSAATLCAEVERRLAAEPLSPDAGVFVEMLETCLPYVSAGELAKELVRRLQLPQERVPGTKRKGWPPERNRAEEACEEQLWPIARPGVERIAELVKDNGHTPHEVFPDLDLINRDPGAEADVEHVLRLAARAAYDFDVNALDDMRHALASTGVYGRFTLQAINCDLLARIEDK